MMYFRPGFRWIPTYRINLPGEEAGHQKATLSLQAEILNEAETLRGVPVDLVVGVPNFRFRTLPSPLCLESTLRNALQRAEPQLMGQQVMLSNALFSQRSGEVRYSAPRAAPAGSAMPDLPESLTTASAHDLFLYHLPPITLARGERRSVPIFTTDVTVHDVYTWDLNLKRQDIAMAPSGSGAVSPLVLSENRIWHQIDLINSTDVPWTTGAAMIMQGVQPLGQELLTYTPRNGTVRFP